MTFGLYCDSNVCAIALASSDRIRHELTSIVFELYFGFLQKPWPQSITKIIPLLLSAKSNPSRLAQISQGYAIPILFKPFGDDELRLE